VVKRMAAIIMARALGSSPDGCKKAARAHLIRGVGEVTRKPSVREATAPITPHPSSGNFVEDPALKTLVFPESLGNLPDALRGRPPTAPQAFAPFPEVPTVSKMLEEKTVQVST